LVSNIQRAFLLGKIITLLVLVIIPALWMLIRYLTYWLNFKVLHDTLILGNVFPVILPLFNYRIPFNFFLIDISLFILLAYVVYPVITYEVMRDRIPHMSYERLKEKNPELYRQLYMFLCEGTYLSLA
jgi:pilus assembly protein TadC